MIKKIIISSLLILLCQIPAANAQETENNYLQASIRSESAIELNKNIIFDASDSFIPENTENVTYNWDFGDGNSDEGIEVFHSYIEPGEYEVSLTINDGENESNIINKTFVYRKYILLISDNLEAKDRIELIKSFAEKEGVYIKIIESFGSSTEFISEEVLVKKLNEDPNQIDKTGEIIVWTQQNAGLNAISRYIQSKTDNKPNFSQKTIIVISNDFGTSNLNRVQNQYQVLEPKQLIIAKEAAVHPLIETLEINNYIESLKQKGYEFILINEKSNKLRPWNFMSYLVNILIQQGIPDNTIALLLLLPVIATIITILKQFVGITTYGIYTPSIMTLSFLIIGIQAGLLTLFAAFAAGLLARLLLKNSSMLFIPKMAIVITLVAMSLLLALALSIYLNLFDAEFLSLAIFPMIILSTLVEKLVRVKSNKNLSSTMMLMAETTFVALLAYFITGGELSAGYFSIKLDLIRGLILSYPELIFLLIIINVILGKWSGLRLIERYRFRELLRNIEE